MKVGHQPNTYSTDDEIDFEYDYSAHHQGMSDMMPRLPIKTHQGRHNKSELPPSILKKKAPQTNAAAVKRGSAPGKKRARPSKKPTGGARAKRKKSLFDQDSDVDGEGGEGFGKLGVLGIPKAIRAAMKKGKIKSSVPGDEANLKSRGGKVTKKGNAPPSTEGNEFEKLQGISSDDELLNGVNPFNLDHHIEAQINQVLDEDSFFDSDNDDSSLWKRKNHVWSLTHIYPVDF